MWRVKRCHNAWVWGSAPGRRACLFVKVFSAFPFSIVVPSILAHSFLALHGLWWRRVFSLYWFSDSKTRRRAAQTNVQTYKQRYTDTCTYTYTFIHELRNEQRNQLNTQTKTLTKKPNKYTDNETRQKPNKQGKQRNKETNKKKTNKQTHEQTNTTNQKKTHIHRHTCKQKYIHPHMWRIHTWWYMRGRRDSRLPASQTTNAIICAQMYLSNKMTHVDHNRNTKKLSAARFQTELQSIPRNFPRWSLRRASAIDTILRNVKLGRKFLLHRLKHGQLNLFWLAVW